MRIFVLGTGRCGSVAFIKACSHIDNFTSAHESLARSTGKERFEYPDDHIEADNRLSWFLGELDSKFGDEALYVHLKRDRDKTAHSFLRRFDRRGSIIHSFAEGIMMTLPETINKEKRLEICYKYVDTIYANIDLFLKDKSKVMNVQLEYIQEEFSEFWKYIGAQGDLDKALAEFNTLHNASSGRLKINMKYLFLLPLLRIWKRITYR